MNKLKDKIEKLFIEDLQNDKVFFRLIQNDEDLWYAVSECKITKEQENYVNPAGFLIGRAYINPNDNVPFVICDKNNNRIGFILLRMLSLNGVAYNWSYFIDINYQSRGYGKSAAMLAINIFKSIDPSIPIKLTTEVDNLKAQNLYKSLGFIQSDELDGNDLVFIL